MTKQEELLLQKALFDDLTPDDQPLLEDLLARSPQAAHKLAGMQRIIQLAAETPQESPPEDLAARIVQAVEQHQAPPLSRRFVLLRELAIRCPYYFLLAGLLHLLLGAALHGVLRTPAAMSQAPAWILWQPEFAFLTGVFFLLCGGMLLARTPHAVRISYGGLVFYIVFVAVNGLALQLQLRTPALMPGLLAFVCMGLTIGALLGALLQLDNKENGNGKTQLG